jgi:hypothetical protein
VNQREAVVGFHGSFYVDPDTLEVRRLGVVAEDIPAELELTAAETRVDYARLRIGDDEFLLPVEKRTDDGDAQFGWEELDPILFLPAIHGREYAVVR